MKLFIIKDESKFEILAVSKVKVNMLSAKTKKKNSLRMASDIEKLTKMRK